MANHQSKSIENTVFVRFNPPSPDITRFHLQDYFSQIGPIRKCSVIRSPSTNKGMGYGFVKFVSKQDAENAALTENGKRIVMNDEQYKLTVELASSSSSTPSSLHAHHHHNDNNKSKDKHTTVQQTTTPTDNTTTTLQHTNDELLQKRKRTSRVIVRNVSFYAKERDIQHVLEQEYGPILELTLPKVNNKLHRGFCFVTFAKEGHAQRAVQPRRTPLCIKKRPVAIDFAVSKQVHQQLQQQQERNKKSSKTNDKNEGDESESSTSSSHDENDDDSSTSNDDSDNDEQQAENASDEVTNEAVKDSDSDSDSDSSNSKEDSDDDDESSEASDDSEVEVDDKPHVPAKPAPDHDDAVDHHRSLFARNLPFDATRHDLFELFSPFGYIESIHLVKDKNTGVAKGTAFLAFRKTEAAQKALEAAGSSGFVTQREGSLTSGQHSGLHLRGRRLFVDLAVDKKTAASLTVEKQGNKVTGKDRRNLYLKMEGRVANESDGATSNNAWENLPESDQLKRQRAFAEKNTKLRSPLFFINSKRLSVRNLAKHVDEVMFKKLCVQATRRGLDTNLVTQEDQVAHWRASGDLTTRDIMKRIEQAKEETGSVIPPFDDKNVKRYIPSVFIDRDFTTNKKEKAPSRGFGFVDFEHHAHALACLRELNNNPYYSAEFVMGGKKAVEAKKQARKRKKMELPKGDFVSEDGRAVTPRLIVDFTVENKAKAKKQAEHRAIQQANVEKQRLEMKEKKLAEQKENKQRKKKKSRGAAQREKKRKAKEGGLENGETHGETEVAEVERMESSKIAVQSETRQKAKPIKPPKKKQKVDIEEQNFDNLVDSYRKAFSGVSEELKDESIVASITSSRAIKKAGKRWFE